MPGSAKEIERMLDITAFRDTIAYGMWRRYTLEPATRYQYVDPREADGVPILARRTVLPGSINERLHTPYDREIVSNKVSYFASNIQLVFDPSLPEIVPEFYQDMIESHGFKSTTLNLAKYSVDQGTTYIMCWVNKEADFKVRAIHAENAFVEYDPQTGEPSKAYRYYIANDEDSFCEVYDGIDVSTFNKKSGEWSLINTSPHGLGTVSRPAIPIIELPNNPEGIGNPEMVISLCDAFDTSMSDLSSEIAQLRLSYLLIQGAGADATGIKEQLQQAGIIVIDDTNGDAKFVDRNMNVAAVQQLQEQLRKLIFEGAASYNPSILSEGNPPTAFEVDLRFRSLEEDTQITIACWENGLRLYDYIVQNYLMFWESVEEYKLTDITRIFRRTAPRNMLPALIEARSAGIELSNQTKVELSGLPIDVVQEAERLEDEKGTPVDELPTNPVVDEVEDMEDEAQTDE